MSLTSPARRAAALTIIIAIVGIDSGQQLPQALNESNLTPRPLADNFWGRIAFDLNAKIPAIILLSDHNIHAMFVDCFDVRRSPPVLSKKNKHGIFYSVFGY